MISNEEYSIQEKIEKNGVPLSQWDLNIYRGILTGYNEAFVISEEERQKILDLSPNADEIIRPFL